MSETDDEGRVLRVSLDPDVCVGAGQCVLSSEVVFDQDDDGTGVVLDPTPPPAEHRAVREAARICPSQAITVEEAAGS